MKASKLNPKNEKIKKEYASYLKKIKEVKIKPVTAKSKLSHIDAYDELFGYKDFIDFDANTGIEFHDFVENKNIAPATKLSYLNDVKDFFTWYLGKTKSKKNQVSALSTLEPSEQLKRLANRVEYVKFPSDDEISKIMDLKLFLGHKALISFQLLTGARASALASTTLECVDLENKLYIQDPLLNIKTKRDKYIVTRFMEFNPIYLETVIQWHKFLVDKHHFKEKHPLFPRIKSERNGDFTITQKPIGGPNEVANIYAEICKAAKIDTYHPHCFRHYAIFKALEYIRTGTQLRALSQNVGHEDLSTILEQYAKMKPEVYSKVIGLMFEHQTNKDLQNYTNAELIEELQRREKQRLILQ